MLVLIAGRGALPAAVAAALEADDHAFVVAALKDSPPDHLRRIPDIEISMDDLGGFFETLQSHGVTTVVMAGAVTRPRESSTGDAASARYHAAKGRGDDGVLRVIISLFEDQGITVRAVDEVLPDLLPPPGILGSGAPTPQDMRDANRAETIQKGIGALDIGQACVVQDGQALAIETRFGTSAMLLSLAGIRADEKGGVFYKAPKPDQDRRADLPLIGPETVDQAARAGVSGLVVEAGGVMVLDLPVVLERLKAHDLYLWIRPRGAAA